MLLLYIAFLITRIYITNSQTCNPTCASGSGVCTANNVCTCQPGWTGSNCGTPLCISNKCAYRHGFCTGPDVCNCFARYTGPDCSRTIAPAMTNDKDFIPEYSYLNDGNLSNWYTFRSWTSGTLVQADTKALRMSSTLPTTDSFIWSKMACPLTEFTINMTIEHNNVGAYNYGDGIRVCVVSNKTALYTQAYVGGPHTNFTWFAGLCMQLNIYVDFLDVVMSSQPMTFSYTGVNSARYANARAILIGRRYYIGLVFRKGRLLTVEYCWTNQCIRTHDKFSYPTSFPINDTAPAVFGVMGSTGLAYGTMDVFDVRVYTLSNCNPSCGKNGICYATNKCFCRPGWSGDLCNRQSCGSKICSSKAYCVAGKCQCFDKWKTGDNCSRNVCDCKNLGRCVGPQLCQCSDGSSRKDCFE